MDIWGAHDVVFLARTRALLSDTGRSQLHSISGDSLTGTLTAFKSSIAQLFNSAMLLARSVNPWFPFTALAAAYDGVVSSLGSSGASSTAEWSPNAASGRLCATAPRGAQQKQRHRLTIRNAQSPPPGAVKSCCPAPTRPLPWNVPSLPFVAFHQAYSYAMPGASSTVTPPPEGRYSA